MIASTRPQIALARRQVAQHARRVPRTRVRFNSSSTTGPSSTASASPATTSPLVAGLAGGGVVLVGGYAYYTLSGTKDMVNSAKSVHQTFKQAKDNVVKNAPSPNEAVQYLRNVAKSYAAFVPGAGAYIDATFDGIDELHAQHREEVDAIVGKAYNDIKSITMSGKMDMATAGKVFDVLRTQGKELADLAARVGGDVLGPLIDKHPELKEKLGGGWDDLRQLAQDAKNTDVAQQAQSVYEDTAKQLSDIFSRGFSAESVKRAKDLVEQKSKQVRDLTQKAAQQIWDKGQNEYLQKAPDEVKQLFSDKDTLKSLTTGSGAMATAVAIWSKVKEVASSKAGFDDKSVQSLKDLVQQKVKEGQEKGSAAKDKMGSAGQMTFEAGWNSVTSWIKTIPGGEKVLENAEDLDVAGLSALVTSKKAEAQDLVKETYSDVVKVLKEKADKAKKLADNKSGSGSSDDGDDGDKPEQEKDKSKDKEKDKSKEKDKKSDKRDGKDYKKGR